MTTRITSTSPASPQSNSYGGIPTARLGLVRQIVGSADPASDQYRRATLACIALITFVASRSPDDDGVGEIDALCRQAAALGGSVATITGGLIKSNDGATP
jgi:hypothetical protein